MTITVQKLADATPAATFWSINNKIARNEKGVLAGFMTSRGGAAYDAQVLKFYYWKDDPAQAQMIRATLPGPFNPPSVVAASTGEFYAFFPDFISNSMYVFYWPDIEANKTPLVTTVGGVSVGGKWSAVFDEARRRVIAIGQSTGKLHFFNDQAVYTGTIEGIRAAGNDARSALQYPALQLCPENRLHIAWCLGHAGQVYAAMRAAAPPDKKYVILPENADEAEAMLRAGYAWLKGNAPERLKEEAQSAPMPPASDVEGYALTQSDELLLDRALDASTEKLYDIPNEIQVSEVKKAVEQTGQKIAQHIMDMLCARITGNIQPKIRNWSMRPAPGTDTGKAWEDGARQGYVWALQELTEN